MYPQPDLTLLALRKRALMGRIRVRREERAEYFAGVLKPVVWMDGVREKWRAVPPMARLAAVPAGLFLARKILPKFGGLLGWAPVMVNLFRSMR
jgi:hypothetical protein